MSIRRGKNIRKNLLWGMILVLLLHLTSRSKFSLDDMNLFNLSKAESYFQFLN